MRPTVSVVGICIVPGRRITTLRMRLRGAMMVHVFEAVRTYIALLFFSWVFPTDKVAGSESVVPSLFICFLLSHIDFTRHHPKGY